MFRGCEYQIWQTVNAWFDLRAGEVLFVEGAEDFDVVGPERAEVVQVKAGEELISLGRADARDALNNFWTLRSNSPHQQIRFRFLTRAQFGIERGHPFGHGVAGLDLWMKPSLSDSEVLLLKEFLTRQDGLNQPLRDWIVASTAADFRAGLLDRVSWEKGSETVEVVERVVQTKLAGFAEDRGSPLPATTTKRIATMLFDEVWKVLRKASPRALDRLRLEELWEEGTRVSVTQSGLDALLQSAADLRKGRRILPTEEFARGAPPAPALIAPRVSLVAQSRSLLSAAGFLNLHGSALAGKTTLSKLLISVDAAEWIWWSSARRQASEVAESLLELRRFVVASAEISAVVIDDVDLAPAARSKYEDLLADLFFILQARRGRLLVTSQKPVSSTFLHVLGLDRRQSIAVPNLALEEVEDLAKQFGLPEGDEHRLWPRLVFAHTQGHPQLVAATLLRHRQAGWPPLSRAEAAADFDTLEAERADARQLLADLPDAQRGLLQRLSVFPSVFRRRHALEIGAHAPSLISSGEVFDPLVGPWVEPLHSGYFALSPLLYGSARSSLGADQFRELQNAAALILVKTEGRSTIEGAMAFQLVWETKNEEAIQGLMMSFTTGMDPAVFAHLADGLRWFTAEAVRPGEMLYPEHRHLSFFLRGLQFRVAAAIEAPNLSDLAAAWLAEAADPGLSEDPSNRMMIAVHVIPYPEVRISAKSLTALLLDVNEAFTIHPELGEQFSPVAPPAGVNWPVVTDLFESLLLFVIWRCDNKTFLDEFVAALNGIRADIRAKIIDGFRKNGSWLRFAIDKVWLHEADESEPQWDHCLAVLNHAFESAVSWQCEPLAIACLRGIAVILDEYQHRPEQAHSEIARLATFVDAESHEVYDRHASVFFSEGNYAAAEENWRIALSRWPPPALSFDHSAAFAARSAGIAAANQEHWDAAATWFLEIPVRLPAPPETYFVAGARADAAFALWQAGRRQDAVNALVDAWQTADSLPQGKDDLRAFNSRKIIGHVIAWVHGEATGIGAGDLHRPLPGVCSSAHVPEQVRDLPVDDPANIWLLLTRIERSCEAGNRAATLAAGRLENSQEPAVRSLAANEAVVQNLLHGRVADLPLQIAGMTRTMQAAARAIPKYTSPALENLNPEVFDPNDDLLGPSVYIAGLVSAFAHQQDWHEVISAWRSTVEPFSEPASWRSWFDEIEVQLGASAEAATRIAGDPQQPRRTLLLACLNLSTNAVSPEDLFLAHVRWLTAAASNIWLKDLGGLYCDIVERAWRRVLERPALLRTPRLSVPAITAACDLNGSSWSKAAQIAMAASHAVTLHMPRDMEADVVKLISAHGPSQ